jgi:hypothetical protein
MEGWISCITTVGILRIAAIRKGSLALLASSKDTQSNNQILRHLSCIRFNQVSSVQVQLPTILLFVDIVTINHTSLSSVRPFRDRNATASA